MVNCQPLREGLGLDFDFEMREGVGTVACRAVAMEKGWEILVELKDGGSIRVVVCLRLERIPTRLCFGDRPAAERVGADEGSGWWIWAVTSILRFWPAA